MAVQYTVTDSSVPELAINSFLIPLNTAAVICPGIGAVETPRPNNPLPPSSAITNSLCCDSLQASPDA